MSLAHHGAAGVLVHFIPKGDAIDPTHACSPIPLCYGDYSERSRSFSRRSRRVDRLAPIGLDLLH